MTDAPLLARKLALVETSVQELRSLARPEAIQGDVREERFVAHTLQIAVQAALDVASYIVSDERLGEPETNRELFERLGKAGWLPEGLAASLQDLADLRNVIVHGPEEVDLGVVEDVVRNQLGELLAFVAAVRARLQA